MLFLNPEWEFYYRLRQVNNDGTFSYSNVVVLENKFLSPLITAVYPNPTMGALNFDMFTAEGGSVDMQVMDLFGKVVYKSGRPLNAGLSSIAERNLFY